MRPVSISIKYPTRSYGTSSFLPPSPPPSDSSLSDALLLLILTIKHKYSLLPAQFHYHRQILYIPSKTVFLAQFCLLKNDFIRIIRICDQLCGFETGHRLSRACSVPDISTSLIVPCPLCF